MTASHVGTLLRDWRHRRRRSQLDLALDVGVSTRHLSYVETGRSRPSPELVLALAEHLEVPLRERNTMLLSAGYAPRFSQTSLDDPALHRARTALRRMLDAHDPYPGVVIDRQWNVLDANRSAAALTAGVAPEVLGPPLNVFRLCLHPEGLARHTVNLDAWAAYLVRTLRRTLERTGDAGLAELWDEVQAYPAVRNVEGRASIVDEPDLLVPVVLDTPRGRLSMFTTLTTFGTPVDVTLAELSVELFYPADDDTERILR